MAPLTGIKVVEAGVMIAVPAAAETLAQFGAGVIKVEDTKYGDELRNYGSARNGVSAWFANANAGKRSISLDLATEDGKIVFWKLLEDADVFIQGFRAGAIGKFGFDYACVSKRCPRLVYCSSTGFGESGPYADQPAYDPIIQSLSGWAGCQLVDGEPSLHKAMVSDKTAASFNVQAILAALVQRGRTGEGCYIEASMLESNIMFNWPDVMMHCSLLEEDGDHLPNLFTHYRLYRCQGGFATIACGTDKQWQSYCEALERPALADDPRFLTAADRSANMSAFFEAIETLSKQFPLQTVVERLRKAGVPVAPVHLPDDVKADEHVCAREFIREYRHPVLGRYLGAKPAASMFGEDLALSPAPMRGEHSKEILTELGYGEAEIRALLKAGSVDAYR